MDQKVSRLFLLASFVGGAVVAGCSGGTSSTPATSPVQQQAAQRSADGSQGLGLDAIGVDACNTPVTEPVNAAGGKFTLAGGCAGINGFVTYASNNAPAGTNTVIEAYPKNPGGVPTPSSGTVLAFLSSNGTATTTFSGSTNAKSQLKGKKLTSAHTYSLYAYALGFLAPGFPVSIGSPATGSHAINFATPLQNGEQVPGNITVYFELVQN